MDGRSMPLSSRVAPSNLWTSQRLVKYYWEPGGHCLAFEARSLSGRNKTVPGCLSDRRKLCLDAQFPSQVSTAGRGGGGDIAVWPMKPATERQRQPEEEESAKAVACSSCCDYIWLYTTCLWVCSCREGCGVGGGMYSSLHHTAYWWTGHRRHVPWQFICPGFVMQVS